MSFSEKKLSGTTVYKGKILDLEVDKVLLDDGTVSSREIVRHPGGAAALLIEDGKALLVKQFRYAYKKEIYEIPAGKIDPGEDPLFAAKRELEEETGFKAELTPLAEIYPSPGYTDEVIHIYFAENSTRSAQKPDEGEFLSAEFIPLERVEKMIKSGEIADSKTVVAVLKYIAYLKK